MALGMTHNALSDEELWATASTEGRKVSTVQMEDLDA
jgi:hypothetical protein